MFREVLMRRAPHECPVPLSGPLERLQDDIAAEPCCNGGTPDENPRGIWSIRSFDLHSAVRDPLINIGRTADDVFLFDISGFLKYFCGIKEEENANTFFQDQYERILPYQS